MLRINNIEIRWQHSNNGEKLTNCEIKHGDNLFVGQAICSEKDNFCKDCGRKLSLKRALKSTEYNKDLRRGIWEAYRRMTKTWRW